MENLKTLVLLQRLDLQLDDLTIMRGDLPDQIEDLEAELEGIKVTVLNAEKFLKEADGQIDAIRVEIEASKEKTAKYKAQQFEVRNNREYDALTKEMDSMAKHAEEMDKKIEAIKAQKEESSKVNLLADPKIKHLEQELKDRKAQLEDITRDTLDEERILLSDRKKLIEKTDKKMIDQYERIRAARDGKVVVKIQRGACGGCFKVIPLQRQAEIKKGTRVFHCEHCGRIIVSEIYFDEIMNGALAVK
ncbi:MAG: hypothetical protein J0L62_14615 [Bacteroidetes bacterium]|nr:hypothetical protein [Bacteroidota bacterium]